MATTLYGTFPLLLPNKTESVSRYGLKKTSGTILFKPGQENDALTLAEQNGSVFPDPQIRTTDMGLLEMSFDAYTDTGARTGVLGSEIVTISAAKESGEYKWVEFETWQTESYVDRKVIAATANSDTLSATSVQLKSRLISNRITGNKDPGSYIGVPKTFSKQISSISRRNFGAFDEVDIVTSLFIEKPY